MNIDNEENNERAKRKKEYVREMTENEIKSEKKKKY